MKIHRHLLLLALGLCALTAYAKDIKTLLLTTTPQMHCAGCETRIKNGLRFERGVKKIETNVEKQTVSVTYDADKTKPENILSALKKIGYEARQLKPGEQAAKGAAPEKCPMK